MFLLGAVFFAGALHGLGPDHLAAITACGAASGGQFRRLAFFSVRFAAGHAAVLLLAGLLASFGRIALPATWERGFELFAGWLLIAAGTALFAGLATGRIRIHAHGHAHGSRHHRHFHLHLFDQQRHEHAHGRLTVALGALFALGAARSLLAVVPVAMARTSAESMLLVATFALGIVCSMVAYGVLAGRMFARLSGVDGSGPASAGALRAASFATALFAVAAGLLAVFPHSGI